MMAKIPGIDGNLNGLAGGFKIYNRDSDVLRLELWTCMDSCKCCQPRVLLFKKNGGSVPEILWEGSWVCDPDEEQQKELLEEMKDAARRYGFKQKFPDDIYKIEFLRKLIGEE